MPYQNPYEVAKAAYQNPYDALTNPPPPPAPITTQGTAISQNLSTAPDLTSLTNLVNQLNQAGQTAASAARIPNAPQLQQKTSDLIGQELSGQIPSDVLYNLQQQGAERGVAMGAPGSDNSNAAYLRALGLTSLDQQQRGQVDLARAYASNPAAPIFDPATMLMTPAQKGQLDYQNALLALDWWNALNNRNGMGGGGGRAPQPSPQPTTAGDMSSFWNMVNSMGQRPTSVGGGGTGVLTSSGSGPIGPFGGYVGYDIPSSVTQNPGVGYDISTPGYGVGYDLNPGGGFNPIFDPTGGVGYDTGYSPVSSGGGGLFDGVSGVGYDQSIVDPSSLYGGY